MLEWNASRRETNHIRAILDRVQKAGNTIDRPQLHMDLEAVHCNGCRLRLGDMVGGKLSDVVHDINGIIKHLDRATGKLKKGFQPRFAA